MKKSPVPVLLAGLLSAASCTVPREVKPDYESPLPVDFLQCEPLKAGFYRGGLWLELDLDGDENADVRRFYKIIAIEKAGKDIIDINNSFELMFEWEYFLPGKKNNHYFREYITRSPKR